MKSTQTPEKHAKLHPDSNLGSGSNLEQCYPLCHYVAHATQLYKSTKIEQLGISVHYLS